MALPVNVGHGTVTGHFVDSNGSFIAGTVTFTPSPKRLLNATASPPTTILPKPVVATLDEGSFTQVLVATDDPDNNPQGWTYRVDFKLTGASADSFHIEVPEDSTVDLTTVAPVGSGAGTIIVRGQGVPDWGDASNGDSLVIVAGEPTWSPGGAFSDGAVAALVEDTDSDTYAAVSALVGEGPGGDIEADDITDATEIGKNVLTAGSAGAARAAIGAGTSSLTLGTGPTNAAVGDHVHDGRYYTKQQVDDAIEQVEVDAGSPDWGEINGDLTDQTDLQNALDGKQAAGDYPTNTELTNALAEKSDAGHTHVIANVSGLSDALTGKQDAGDLDEDTAALVADDGSELHAAIVDLAGEAGGEVAWGDVTGKPTFAEVATSGDYGDLDNLPDLGDLPYRADDWNPDLSAYATTSALTSGLSGKADTSHNHNASAINAGTLNADRIPTLDQDKVSGLEGALAGKLDAGSVVGVGYGTSLPGSAPNGTVFFLIEED